MTEHRTLLTRVAILFALLIGALAIARPAVAIELSHKCTNPEDGYTVRFPEGWHVNQFVEGGEADDVAACRFFGPEAFTVRPATAISGIAIAIGREATAPRAEGQEATVDGRSAVILETVAADGDFDPAGTRYYQYWIDVGSDWLVATTSDGPAWVGEYEANRETLDAVIEGLTFLSPTLPDTAVDRAFAPSPAPVAVLLLMAIASTFLARGRRG
jgi:hypothetical protein